MASPTKTEIDAFSITVVKIAKEKGISYLDSVMYVCEKKKMDPEVASSLINSLVKEKIQKEAEELNILKTKKSRLPID